tara:strand:- start:37 stop:432 length:396 start_codon:yes stop_codon:yes gene_type:complete
MSQAKFINTKLFNSFNIAKLIKDLKRQKKDISRYCFHKKNSTSNQIMIVNRTKHSYKILEKSRGLTAVFILTGKMKIKIKHKNKKDQIKILGASTFFTFNKNLIFENEISSKDCTMIEFCSKRPKIIKRFY